jgi:hypothetical protein
MSKEKVIALTLQDRKLTAMSKVSHSLGICR